MSTEYTLAVNRAIAEKTRLTTEGLIVVDRYSRGSMIQYSEISSASGNPALGAQIAWTFDFTNNEPLSKTIYHNMLVYTITNKDTTDSITFPRGCLDHFEELKFQFEGREAFKLSRDEIFELYSRYFMMQGHNIYTNTHEIRQGELDVVAGHTIGPLASKTFRLFLTPILNFYGKTVFPPSKGGQWGYGAIKEIKVIGTFVRPAASQETASQFCYSTSAAVNMLTVAKLDISLCGSQTIYQNNTQATDVVPLFKDLTGTNKKFVLLVPSITEKEVYRGTVTAAQELADLLTSDVTETNGIQHYNTYLQKVPTTYSDTASGLKLSGHRYLSYILKQTTNDPDKVDLTDPIRLKQYEMDLYRKDFGIGNRLPMEFWNSDSMFTKTYLNMTRFNFDNYQVGSAYETVCHFNNSNKVDDYKPNIFGVQTLSGTYKCMTQLVAYEEYAYNWNAGMERYELDKVTV